MDTSDSECFESADEELLSDYEESSVATTKRKEPEKQVVDALKNCKIQDDNLMDQKKQPVYKEETKNTSAVSAANTVPATKKVEAAPTSTSKKRDITKLLNKYLDYDEDKTSDTDKNAESAVENKEVQLNSNGDTSKSTTNSKQEHKLTDEQIADGFGIPPDVCECWEPGVNYPIEEYNAVFRPDKCKTEEKEETSSPPEMSACWEPGMDYPMEEYNAIFKKDEVVEKSTNSDANKDKHQAGKENDSETTMVEEEKNKKVESKKNDRGFGVPPTVSSCWEPGVNYPMEEYNAIFKKDQVVEESTHSDANKDKHQAGKKIDSEKTMIVEKVSKKVESKKNDRGFGVPPNVSSCWEPGVNYPMEEYNKIFRKDTVKAESDTETDVKSTFKEVGIVPEKEDASKPETDTNTIKPADKKIETTKKKVVFEQKPATETDGWEEDDLWGKDELEWGEDDNKNENSKMNIDEVKPKGDEQKPDNDMWGEDDLWNEDEAWEPVEKEDVQIKQKEPVTRNPINALDNLTKDSGSGWGSWGGWGLSSVISTATAGVSTLTSHVSQGLSTVLESGIGVPDPEELARLHKEESIKLKSDIEEEPSLTNQDEALPLGLGNLVSGVSNLTKFVEKTSSKVITGGLNTLETIGKKTVEVLQENDPGLKRKRAFLKIDQDRPILSQILREAKEKAEEESKAQIRPQKRPNYEWIFDDYQGLVHLEALEMLSKQCDIKLQDMLENLHGDKLRDLQETFAQVKDLCELPEEDDEEIQSSDPSAVKEELRTIFTTLETPLRFDNFIEIWERCESSLSSTELSNQTELEIHKHAIETLAHITATAVEHFHKIGELLLIKERRSTADEADSLVHLTQIYNATITSISEKYSGKLTSIVSDNNNKDLSNELITNVFFEAANSCSYVNNAFQLIIPVLQRGTV